MTVLNNTIVDVLLQMQGQYADLPDEQYDYLSKSNDCRNACSGACDGDCSGSCDMSCSGGAHDLPDY